MSSLLPRLGKILKKIALVLRWLLKSNSLKQNPDVSLTNFVQIKKYSKVYGNEKLVIKACLLIFISYIAKELPRN